MSTPALTTTIVATETVPPTIPILVGLLMLGIWIMTTLYT